MIRFARAGAVVAAAVLSASALSGAAAAPASMSATTAAWWCVPIPKIWECDEWGKQTPAPTPSATATDAPSAEDPGDDTASDADGDEPGADTPPAEDAPPEEGEPAEAVADDTAPVFTQPPAQMGSESLSFTGLKGISLVKVPLADGSEATALKISAETITVDGFALTVGHFDAPGLVTTADRMTLSGDVSVYLNSLTATTAGGQSLTLGADTPPPKDGIEPTLLRVTFGLVGATADSITYSNTDQRMVE
ncbi:hypothetical protein [Microbacterium sp. GXF7504]